MSINKVCPYCDGAGCGICQFTGVFPFGNMADLPGMVMTHEILESINPTEYNALSDANKSSVSMILSCGQVDLRTGTSVRAKLWNLFGEGTTTRTALETLLSLKGIV